MKQKTFILFFGPPGSGKGTQADMLGERIHFPVISPGELLRHEQEKNTKIGRDIDNKMSGGNLVPDSFVEKIISKRLAKKDAKNGFIFDGYPRRESQLGYLKNKFEKISSDKDIILAFYIHISDCSVKARLGGRRVCDCGASYHLKFNPPLKKGRCDLCEKKLSRRKDDDPRVVAKRLKDFHSGHKPLLEYFKKHYKLININGEKSIKEVRKEIWKKMKSEWVK
ncbi:MAG: nucleoside monophosphate kinase [bacterium]